MAGPTPYPESSPPESVPQQPFPAPGQQAGNPGPYPSPYPGQVPAAYPGHLPPPVDYPRSPRRKRFISIGVVVVVLALVAGVVTAIALSAGKKDDALAVTDSTATTAIQGYLDALAAGNDDVVARNNSCGFYDAVKDRRSDMTLANLTSDAFRRQFSEARVSTIDKIVTWSPTQSQVLFTLRAKPAGRTQGEVERQGIAQLLLLDGQILVCSYLPRSTGQY